MRNKYAHSARFSQTMCVSMWTWSFAFCYSRNCIWRTTCDYQFLLVFGEIADWNIAVVEQIERWERCAVNIFTTDGISRSYLTLKKLWLPHWRQIHRKTFGGIFLKIVLPQTEVHRYKREIP